MAQIPWWRELGNMPDWARQFELSKMMAQFRQDLQPPQQTPAYPSVDRRGGGGAGGRMQTPKWSSKLFSDIYGRLGTEETGRRDWIKELMGLARGNLAGVTGDLSRGLGAHLSRTNVPIPAGADVLARRHLSPMTRTIESQLQYLQQLLKEPQSKFAEAISLTGQMLPYAGRTGFPFDFTSQGYGNMGEPWRNKFRGVGLNR